VDEHNLGNILDTDVYRMQRDLQDAFPGINFLSMRRYWDSLKSDLFSKLRDRIVEERRMGRTSSLESRLERISIELQATMSERYRTYSGDLLDSLHGAGKAAERALRNTVDVALVEDAWTSSVMIGLSREFAGEVLPSNPGNVARSSLTISFRGGVPPKDTVPASYSIVVFPPFGPQEAREAQKVFSDADVAVENAVSSWGRRRHIPVQRETGQNRAVSYSLLLSDKQLGTVIPDFGELGEGVGKALAQGLKKYIVG